jgi:hypothetical protein
MSEHFEIMTDWQRNLGAGATAEDYDSLDLALVVGSGVALVIGHSDGEVVGRANAETVAERLQELPGYDRHHTVVLCACGAGSGSFASRLQAALPGRPQVFAPVSNTSYGDTGGVVSTIVAPQGDGFDLELLSNWILIA